MFDFGWFLFLGIIFLVIILFLKSIFTVQQQQCVVIERLGKFQRILYSGLNIIVPFIDAKRQMLWIHNGRLVYTNVVDLRETVFDIPEQKVITRDNVAIQVDALIYIQITDVKRAVYEIQSLPTAVSQLTQTTLRSLIGEMDLDHTLSSRDTINTRLKSVLDEATDKWGLKVTRVELKNVNPPEDVQLAMEKQMQAERERRASVLTAEGRKQSQILIAEGEKQSLIAKSEGERQEKINQASGQAKGIELVASAQARAITMLKDSFGNADTASNYLIAMEYLKKFGDITQKNSDKVFIPYEATGVLASLGSIKEMLNKDGQ